MRRVHTFIIDITDGYFWLFFISCVKVVINCDMRGFKVVINYNMTGFKVVINCSMKGFEVVINCNIGVLK